MASNNASGIRAGRAYVELGANDRLSAALDNAKKKIREFGDAASAVGGGIQTAGLAIMTAGTAIIGSLAAAGLSFAKVGSELNDLSQRTGVSVEALGELQFVFGQAGVDSTHQAAARRGMMAGRTLRRAPARMRPAAGVSEGNGRPANSALGLHHGGHPSVA